MRVRARRHPLAMIVLAAALVWLGWRTSRALNSESNDGLPSAGTVIADAMRSGGTAPEMIVIPSGAVRITDVEAGWRVQQWLTAFTADVPRRIAVARTETTVASFRRFVAASGFQTESGCYFHTVQQQWIRNEHANWTAPGFVQADDHPVTCVTFEDAQAYVAWLSAETHARYRLPTELEFEFFNRAGRAGTHAFDLRDTKDLCAATNGADRAAQFAYAYGCDDGHEFTAPVASFPPNAFGLYDTTGNLWELTTDCWQSDYMRAAWHLAGFESRPLTGRCHGRHVVRGGSFISSRANLQIGKRDIEGDRSTRVGFRVVRDLP